jgi:uncharacterized protein YodC (DUF2158 family)
MRENIFTANEVVRLLTGGPEMYVEGPGTADGQVWCTFSHFFRVFSIKRGNRFPPKLVQMREIQGSLHSAAEPVATVR